MVIKVDWNVAHEIGNFISSQMKDAPLKNSSELHIQQGLVLEVNSFSLTPKKIYTPHGVFNICKSSAGSFKQAFETIKSTCGLQKMGECSDCAISLWAVRIWNGEKLEEPIFKEGSDCSSLEKACGVWKGSMERN